MTNRLVLLSPKIDVDPSDIGRGRGGIDGVEEEKEYGGSRGVGGVRVVSMGFTDLKR